MPAGRRPGPAWGHRPGTTEAPQLSGPGTRLRPAGRQDRLPRGRTSGTDVGTWTFDVCTNTWLQLHPDPAPASGRTARQSGSPTTPTRIVPSRSCPPGADRGVDLRPCSQPLDPGLGSAMAAAIALGLVYDPVSGLLVMRDAGTREMWAYDVDQDRWTSVPQGPVMPRAMRTSGLADRQILGYDASADRFVLYVEGEPAWTFDARTERWSQDGDTSRPPALWFAWVGSGTASAWDEAARRTLFVSGRARSDMAGVAAYDATRHAWETLWNGTPCLDSTFVYDAINGRLACMADASPKASTTPPTQPAAWQPSTLSPGTGPRSSSRSPPSGSRQVRSHDSSSRHPGRSRSIPEVRRCEVLALGSRPSWRSRASSVRRAAAPAPRAPPPRRRLHSRRRHRPSRPAHPNRRQS